MPPGQSMTAMMPSATADRDHGLDAEVALLAGARAGVRVGGAERQVASG